MDEKKVFNLLKKAIFEIDPTASEVSIRYYEQDCGGIGDTFEISIPQNRTFRESVNKRLVYKDVFPHNEEVVLDGG